ncbi:hypothetical protein PIB30_097095, partial [Stylosanthes scabra]|nr:hypothetical protein [Stylosanthes scabra]
MAGRKSLHLLRKVLSERMRETRRIVLRRSAIAECMLYSTYPRLQTTRIGCFSGAHSSRQAY